MKLEEIAEKRGQSLEIIPYKEDAKKKKRASKFKLWISEIE